MPKTIRTILTIVGLTIREAQRRRILWALLLMGSGFLILFGVGFHYLWLDVREMSVQGQQFPVIFLTQAGLYVTNFLIILISVLISVAGISAEIENHTLDVLITKPVYRWHILAGKWVAYAIMILVCVLLLPGGVLLIVFLRSGYALPEVPAGLSLVYLSGLIVMSIAVFGGTRLSTLANGAFTFMLYGIAFVGGWVEQIGAFLRNEAAVNIGIISSLILPVDVLWRRASSLMTPADLIAAAGTGPAPFLSTAQPSERMMWYAVAYMVVFVVAAMYSLANRDV